MLRLVTATRYVTPLREGGLVPALVEGDDDGLYVVKLRGAAQGPPMLVAEVIAAGLARAAGLEVPDVVAVALDPVLGKNEPDPELRELLLASGGVNVGLDFLPGSVTYEPVADPAPDAALASRIVLFDAFVTNPDRTAKNPNMLRWQKRLWLIDHGAALYFHYSWKPEAPLAGADRPFALIGQHVLAARATRLREVAAELATHWSPSVVADIVQDVPEDLLHGTAHVILPSRAHYAAWLDARVAALPAIAEEAARVCAQLV